MSAEFDDVKGLAVAAYFATGKAFKYSGIELNDLLEHLKETGATLRFNGDRFVYEVKTKCMI